MYHKTRSMAASKIIADQPLTHWDTNPRLCRSLAFLRAHAVTLQARQRLR